MGYEAVLGIYSANLLFIFAYGAFFLVPVHLRDLGASNAVIGLLTASTGVTNTAALFWLLTKGFKKDPRRLMLIGVLLFGAGSIGMALSENLWAIAVMRMLHGAGFCLYFIAANTFISHHAPEEDMAKQMGYFGAVTLMAQSVAPAIAEVIARKAGFPVLFTGTVMLLALSFLTIRRLPLTEIHHLEAGTGETGCGGKGLTPFGLGALALLGGGLFGGVITFSPLYLIECGIVPVSLFFMSYALSAVAVRLVFRNAADTMGHLAIARLCFGILALSVLGMSYSTTALTFGLSSALFGAGHGLMYPALAAYSINALKGGRLRGMAVWAGGFAIGVSLGAWLAGIVAESYPIALVFRLEVVMGLACVALLWKTGGNTKAA